jgi:hypothetical protein
MPAMLCHITLRYKGDVLRQHMRERRFPHYPRFAQLAADAGLTLPILGSQAR